MKKRHNQFLLFDAVDFYISLLLRNYQNDNFKCVVVPSNNLRRNCDEACQVLSQSDAVSDKMSSIVHQAKSSIINFVDHMQNPTEIKFLFYPFCTGNHFVLLVAVWPFVIEEKHSHDKVVGYFVLDSLQSTCGDNDIPKDCGFMFLLNFIQSYIKSDWYKKDKSTMKQIDVVYTETHGTTTMRRGSMQFPLIIADQDVFLKQNDVYNCGTALIGHFIEFYVHQTQCSYSNESNAFEKPTDRSTSDKTDVVIVADNSIMKFNLLWMVNKKSLDDNVLIEKKVLE